MGRQMSKTWRAFDDGEVFEVRLRRVVVWSRPLPPPCRHSVSACAEMGVPGGAVGWFACHLGKPRSPRELALLPRGGRKDGRRCCSSLAQASPPEARLRLAALLCLPGLALLCQPSCD